MSSAVPAVAINRTSIFWAGSALHRSCTTSHNGVIASMLSVGRVKHCTVHNCSGLPHLFSGETVCFSCVPSLRSCWIVFMEKGEALLVGLWVGLHTTLAGRVVCSI